MTGRLRSKRCQRCRRRKIKCDENWPCCGQCLRSNAQCSGPPVGSRYHVPPDARFANPTTSYFPGSVTYAAAPSPQHAVLTHTGTAPGTEHAPVYLPVTTASGVSMVSSTPSSTVPYFEYAPFITSPRPDPTTTAERVAARLLGYLDKNAGYDASLSVGYLHLLPARIGESSALRDAVAIFTTCWGGMRRAMPPHKIFDSRAYGKALRSLQKALDDPEQQLKCETLAAISVLDRVEILFDPRRTWGVLTHTKGAYTLMKQRGPPDPNDDLDVCLAFSNQISMLYNWYQHGLPNLFSEPRWIQAMDSIVESPRTEEIVPPHFLDRYRLHRRTRCWQLAAELRASQVSTQPAPEHVSNLRRLRGELSRARAEMPTIFHPLETQALEDGMMREVAAAKSPTGTKYEFSDVKFLQRWDCHVWVWLGLCHMQTFVDSQLGIPTDAIEQESYDLSRRIWKCLPQMMGMGSHANTVFVYSISLCFEAGAEEERDHVIKLLWSVDKYKQRLDRDWKALEAHILRFARVCTGRLVEPASVSPQVATPETHVDTQEGQAKRKRSTDDEAVTADRNADRAHAPQAPHGAGGAQQESVAKRSKVESAEHDPEWTTSLLHGPESYGFRPACHGVNEPYTRTIYQGKEDG